MNELEDLKETLNELTVLYVEDNQLLRNSLVKILNRLFKDVLTAKDGKEALKISFNHKPDLLITDLNMPNMSGLELIRKIREINPAIEIIIISGFFEVDSVLNSFHLGVTDYISKPVDDKILKNALKRAGSNVKSKIDLMNYRKKDLQEQTDVMSILNTLYKEKIQIELINYFKGVPIINQGLIKEIKGDLIFIQTRALQKLIINLEKETFIESYLFSKPIKMKLNEMSGYIKPVVFNEAKIIPFSFRRRDDIRLIPNKSFKLYLLDKENEYLSEVIEISIQFITFGFNNKVFSKTFNIEDTINLKAIFTIGKESDICELNLKGEILKVYKKNETHKFYVFKIDLKNIENNLLHEYIFYRELEIIEELRALRIKEKI